ncbi:MAG: H-type lectin domain-containing protein [Aliishimia sp.]
MKRLRNHLIGVDQGDPILFSDFDIDGEMWTGRGARERRKRINFSEVYRNPPVVHLSISLWDVDASTVIRSDIQTDAVTTDGFDMVFRTWGDTRVARVRVSWMSIGELANGDEWDLY